MTSKDSDSLDLEQQFLCVTSEIEELLIEINSLTSPGGEVDEALNNALDSFIPLLNAYHIKESHLHCFARPPDINQTETFDIEERLERNAESEELLNNNVEVNKSKGKLHKGHPTKGSKKSSETNFQSTPVQASSSFPQDFAEPEYSKQNPRRSKRGKKDESKKGTGETEDDSVYESLTHYVNLKNPHNVKNESEVI